MATKTDRLEIEIIASDHASKTLQGLGGTLGGLGKTGGVVTGIVAGIGAGLGALTFAAVNVDSQLETSTLQFETLLGSADGAKKHIADLYKFGAETPFETGPIIKASKSLLTFGGTTLDTMANLRKFGDAAAVTDNSIDDVSYTMGRAYSAIQAGKPFGEAAQRLQEMGILTAEGRLKLEDLQKSGADTSAIWASLMGNFDRFNGSMKKQAGTWEGLTSSIEDIATQAIGQALLPAFDALKVGLQLVLAAISTPEFQASIQQISLSFAGLVAGVIQAMPSLITGFQGFIGFIVTNKPVLIGTLAALGTAVAMFGATVAIAAWGAISPFLPAIGIMAAVGIAAGVLYAAWTSDFGGIRTTTMQAWTILQPVFEQIRQWLVVALPVASAILKNYWDNVLAPTFRFLGAVIGEVFRVAGALIVTWVRNSVSDFQNIVGFIGIVIGAFNNISNAIAGVIGWAHQLVSALMSIQLPSWLTPGSPTPFELGLRGISKAMDELTTSKLPEFAIGLNPGNGLEQMPFGRRGLAAVGAGGPQVAINYQPVFSTVDAEELRLQLQPMLDKAIRAYNRGTSK